MKGDFHEFAGASDPEDDFEPDESSSSDDDIGEKHESVEDERHWGRMLIDPSICAGMTHIGLLPGFEERGMDIRKALEWQVEQLEKGDTSQLAGILTTQAFTLNSLFQRSLQVATKPNQSLKHAELFYRVALRAQAQSVKVIEAAAKIHRNDAGKGRKTQKGCDGEQVSGEGISNSVENEVAEGKSLPSRSSKTKSQTNETHAALDPRSTRKTVASHSKVAAVERINGTSNRRR